MTCWLSFLGGCDGKEKTFEFSDGEQPVCEAHAPMVLRAMKGYGALAG